MRHKIQANRQTVYTSTDLAKLFCVNESTVKRWADAGKLSCFRTVGNHRRFTSGDVVEFAVRYHLEEALTLHPQATDLHALVTEALRAKTG